jgi:hypothetical protein
MKPVSETVKRSHQVDEVTRLVLPRSRHWDRRSSARMRRWGA